LDEGCISDRLLSDRFVCLVRAGHSIAGTRLTKSSMMELRYVYASTGAPSHQLTEQWLSEIGVDRQIVLRVVHFTVAPEIMKPPIWPSFFLKALPGA